MITLGKIQSVKANQIWPTEDGSFTPWLSDNLAELGDALGLSLNFVQREVNVGKYKLDILAKDDQNRNVIIENQYNDTDHGHLGQLLTYASGLNAEVLVWITESARDEHRQAIEWLNQITDEKIELYLVAINVIKIGDSLPALNFKVIASPNHWQKEQKKVTETSSPRNERYRNWFQNLIDILREEYKFTNARAGQPQSWYNFSAGISGITIGSSFTLGNKFRCEIYIDTTDKSLNKKIFDDLEAQKNALEAAFEQQLSWERLDDKRASRIAIYTIGGIDQSEEDLSKLTSWAICQIIKLKKIYTDFISAAHQKAKLLSDPLKDS